MSGPSPPGPNGATTDPIRDPELDVSKLHALPTEQQDLYLLTFVSELKKHVEQLSAESLPVHQASIKKEVIKIIGLGSPIPSRVLRNALGKTLADAFGRGSRSLLYETINELLTLINTGKGDKEQGTRHAAAVCLGELFYAAGDSAVSLAALVVQTLLKLSKVSHVGIKGCSFRALSLLVQGVNGSLDELMARDIWKQARHATMNEKSAFVQISACKCMQSLLKDTTFFNNSNDFDNLKTSVWKAIDSPVAGVRRAAAGALAASFRQTYSEVNRADVPLIRKPKKSSKKQGAQPEDEIEDERPNSPPSSQVKSSVRLTLSLVEILRVLSTQYCKAATTNRARAGLALTYRFFLRSLPRKVVEQNYGTVAEHLFVDLINHATIVTNRYRLLLTRRFVRIILHDTVAAELLTENSQINAGRFLINDVLKNYPQVVKENREPSKRVLVAALDALTDLLQRLGSAAHVFQDSCREALCQVMQHPSFAVQSYVAQCAKAFVFACPSQLVTLIDHGMAKVAKELEPNSESRTGPRKAVGYSMGIAAMLNSARETPLYGSIELFARIFAYATELLKSSAASELRLSAAQLQVAWTLIGGLMNLGPSFVKVHQNQLLTLWRNALPPPLTQENAAKRGHLELSFLAHVRECALSALLLFLDTCSALITSDGSRRISVMLQNTVLFLESLPAKRSSEDISHRLVPALQLQDIAIILRRRTLQCFAALISLKHLEQSDIVSQSDLVGLTLRTFTNPERPSQHNLEASLASSASNYEGLWETGDNWGFGVTSLVQASDMYLPLGNRFEKARGIMNIGNTEWTAFDVALQSPTVPALEHDPAILSRASDAVEYAELCTPATTCVNMAIKLFSIALPLQSARVQEGSLEQLVTILSQPLQRDPGKKAAMLMNSSLALLFTLIVANQETSFSTGRLQVRTAGKILTDILRRCLEDADVILRGIGAAALGRLCNLGGAQLTNSEVKSLIDTIVSNRDPHVRAGCALALGYIHSEVGAMGASLHIKSIVGVLLSLCSDTHPIVHYWALKGLVQVAESAGLTFSPYASSTLGMLAQLYSSDSHNDESASVATSNLELDYDTSTAIAQCVDCIINVLGPDLQDVSKTRNLILTLLGYFQREDSVAVMYQSYMCLSHSTLR